MNQSSFDLIFILVWIFGSIFILLANVAYLDLKDRKKNKRKNNDV